MSHHHLNASGQPPTGLAKANLNAIGKLALLALYLGNSSAMFRFKLAWLLWVSTTSSHNYDFFFDLCSLGPMIISQRPSYEICHDRLLYFASLRAFSEKG
jgi:hypothetical protein